MTTFKDFEFWTKEKLWQLRQEICLNSLYYSDYTNSFGIDTHKVCDFFDGFLDYCQDDLIESTGKQYPTIEEIFEMDTADNLWDYWYLFLECPFAD